MNKHSDYKRTEGKGLYNNKEDKNHKVIVYDITFCVDDETIYYSYMDPMFDIRRLSTTKDKFLDKFEFMGTKFKRLEIIMKDEKGFYRHKCYKDYMVCVYDISYCEENNLWYYSYMDPHIGFDGGCRKMPKNVFLKRYESIN